MERSRKGQVAGLMVGEKAPRPRGVWACTGGDEAQDIREARSQLRPPHRVAHRWAGAETHGQQPAWQSPGPPGSASPKREAEKPLGSRVGWTSPKKGQPPGKCLARGPRRGPDPASPAASGAARAHPGPGGTPGLGPRTTGLARLSRQRATVSDGSRAQGLGYFSRQKARRPARAGSGRRHQGQVSRRRAEQVP